MDHRAEVPQPPMPEAGARRRSPTRCPSPHHSRIPARSQSRSLRRLFPRHLRRRSAADPAGLIPTDASGCCVPWSTMRTRRMPGCSTI
jgi:hypothetical protein